MDSPAAKHFKLPWAAARHHLQWVNKLDRQRPYFPKEPDVVSSYLIPVEYVR